MKKPLLILIIFLAFASCAKKGIVAAKDDIKVKTNFAGGSSYEVKVTENDNGQTTVVIDTIVTGSFTYETQVPDADKVTVEVDSNDALSSQPTVVASENGAVNTDTQNSDTGGEKRQVTMFGCCYWGYGAAE